RAVLQSYSSFIFLNSFPDIDASHTHGDGGP
ncbi:MAG: hypothetical protein ACI8W7_000212, partial [Gammaproteobacteria bacterium]